MPLEPDERMEVEQMINVHFDNKVMPLHRENLTESKSLRQEIQGLKDMIKDFFGELRGEEKERKRAAEARAGELAETNINIAKSNRLSGWTLVVATIALVLIGALTVYVAVRASSSQTSSHTLSHDPSIQE